MIVRHFALLAQQLQPLELRALRSPSALTHGLFRFPGRFHPPLVTYLLQLHPNAKVVGDPMVGCGTVAVEATASGRSGLFSDVDPLACLLTRAKTNPVNPQWLAGTVEAIIRASQPVARLGVSRSVAKQEIDDLESSTDFRAPPNVFHWFAPYVVVNLCRALQGIAALQSSPRRKEVLLAIFASIVRRVSRADPHTASGLEVTKIRKEELARGLRFDVSGELRKRTEIAASGYNELRRVANRPRVVVVEGDARQWSEICAKDHLI